MNDAEGSAKVWAHESSLRVRYSETDQLGTFYNSRALEWFECGRTELMRAMGLPYTQWEKQGVFLPLVESHVFYRGRARYDDLLRLQVTLTMAGRASLRFDVRAVLAGTEQLVTEGYTVHALVDADGRPIRPPAWLQEKLPPLQRND